MIDKIGLRLLGLCFLIFSCTGIDSESSAKVSSAKSQKIDNNECLKWLSSADINRRDGSYQGCVDSYNVSLLEGCGSQYAEQIYQWMGRAYIQLGKLDSAKWSVDKGLRILPEDLQLLNVAAFVSNKQNRLDDQL